MDEYDDDYDEGYTYDDDWLYVEDDCPLADDLAETQIADAGYAGTNYDIWYEHADYDLYMFWDDQEYGHDEYWDYGGAGPTIDATKVGQKRRGAKPTNLTAKRRKVTQTQRASSAGGTHSEDNVVFLSQEERRQRIRGMIPVLKKKKQAFAFLPDWRTRFSNIADSPPAPMPAAMKKAAESPDDTEDNPAVEPDVQVYHDHENDGHVHDGNEEDEVEDDEGEEISPDPDALKAVLMQRLSEAGLNGVDQEAYMEAITKMLSGNGAADDAVAELANSLLGNATSDQGDGVSGWLAQQGVSLDSVHDDDDASSVATAELPEAPPTTLKKRSLPIFNDSPADSAIQVSNSSHSSTNKSGRRVKFAVPSSTESSQEKAAPKVQKPTSSMKSEGQPSAPLEGHANHVQNEGDDEPDSDTIDVKPRGATESSEPTQPNTEIPKSKATKATTKRKSSRKRKADSDEEEVVEEKPAPKRTRAARAKARATK